MGSGEITSVINFFIGIINAFASSGFFIAVKFFLAIYVTVLFVDIVLILIVRGVGGNIRTAIKGTSMPIISKKKMQEKWQEIEDRIASGSASQFKLAILEADNLANEVLLELGFSGKNMKEKLENATEKQIENINDLMLSHKLRNEIINNRNFFIDEGKTREVMGVYRKFLDDVDVI